MNAHVGRRRTVAQQLSSGTPRVWCWSRRGGSPSHVRLGPRPVGWTGRPGLGTHRPRRGHPPALPLGAHAVEGNGLSRDVSTQVAASRTLPPHVGVGGRQPDAAPARGCRWPPAGRCPRTWVSVAASRTLPPHVGVGGRPPSHLDSGGPDHAVPQVPPDSATRASRRCARGARVRDEAHGRREGTRRQRVSCVARAIEGLSSIQRRDVLSACEVGSMVRHA